MATPLYCYEGDFRARPAYDVALSRALLDAVGRGAPAALRLHQPGDVLAFSSLDRTQPGFAAALRAARAAGFASVLRLAGGRAALFHEQTIAFAWCCADPAPRRGIHARFKHISDIVRDALSTLGVDARVGMAPGEYCPGAYSVNARGVRKLMGVGQRLVRSAAYLGGVLVVRDAERVRAVLQPVYKALNLDWDPATVGAVEDELPGVTRADVLAALRRAFSRQAELVPAEFTPALLRAAEAREAEHRVDVARKTLRFCS